MVNSLEERLKAHSNAFDGLLSLIPAKYYYDEETSNQWQAKKQSKEEKKENKRRKLDPELAKEATAEEVLKLKEKDATPAVIPGGARKEEAKKQEENAEDASFMKSDLVFDDNGDNELESSKANAKPVKANNAKTGKDEKPGKPGKKVLTEEEKKLKEKHLAELRAKLSEKINTMRAKRKAPGSNVAGAATSRQQILEERRRKRELKKLRKEEEKNEEDESSDDDDDDDDDDDVDEEEEAAEAQNGVIFGNIEFGDGERMTSDLQAIRTKVGGKMKKGPANKDVKAHLRKLVKEKEALKGMDKDKRARAERKSQWSRALASIEGAKLKDNEQLLKKSLRRKESKKRKSERQWGERKKTLAQVKRAKFDRREENIRIRKENKGRTKNNRVKQLPSYKKITGASLKRAGFEGRLKTKSGRKPPPSHIREKQEKMEKRQGRR